ncbi:TPA: hypothetical protein ENS27_17380 [bacterium]|nr:hypothetical protein [bacterium]
MKSEKYARKSYEKINKKKRIKVNNIKLNNNFNNETSISHSSNISHHSNLSNKMHRNKGNTIEHHNKKTYTKDENLMYSLKEEILDGTEKTLKQEHVTEKEFEITDKHSYKFTADDILRRLFIVDEKKKKKVSIKEKTYLKTILSQAGYEVDPELFRKRVFRYNIILVSLWTVYLLIRGFVFGLIDKVFVPILISWLVFYPLLLLVSWGIIFFVLDYKKYKRKKELEEVWPEYLQLVVSNINAGMLIDVALWSAVKPKYKVLAKEIEQVAKQTLTGKELSEALQEFAEKYDSVMVKRTINLLIEGMESGGKIATLLNKISLDIQETKIMRKEMSASVMTYSIFISFATIAAAPFLFALSTQLLIVIQTIIGKLGETSTTTMVSFSADSVKISDFKIFAYIMLTITSFMSACLIGSIRRGSIKDGLKFIPLFIIGTLVIYYFSSLLLASLFGNLI